MFGVDPFSPWLIAYVTIVILFSGWVQGALGMGFPMVATPLIAAATNMQFAVVTILLPCLATVVVTLAKSPDLRQVVRRFWWMPLCALIGAAIGAALFVRFPQFPYALLVAGIILFYLYLQRHAHLQWSFLKLHDKASGIICGFLSGLCESTANIAAPPLIIYYLGIGLPPLMLVPAMNIGSPGVDALSIPLLSDQWSPVAFSGLPQRCHLQQNPQASGRLRVVGGWAVKP
ncbi:MAG: sulfite exporter TauE/SafE family protein [Burkholderiales bacterium]